MTHPGARPVSVVVATRQRRDRLLATLERLGASGADEVVVVDNGSTDGSGAAVRSAHPDVRVVELPANRGAAARTVGVQVARNPVVAFADDDSWWAPGALARAARHLAAYPHVAVVAARMIVEPHGRLDPVCVDMAASPLPADRPLPGPRVLGFVACGAVVRRTAYLAVGGFSDLLFFMGEERLLALDLAGDGWDLCYVPDVVAHHAPASSGVDRSAVVARNDLLTTWLRRPVHRALAATASVGRRAVADRSARSALVGACARLPRAIAGRRRLPTHVERDVRLLERAGERRGAVSGP